MGGPEIQPEVHGADGLLRAYLARGDAPCPSCGYNLRGVETAACPECGTELSLTLQRRRPLAGWTAFLILAFGWVFLAGSMNTTRGVTSLIRTKQQMERQSAQVQAFSSFRSLQLVPAPPPPIAALPSRPHDTMQESFEKLRDESAKPNAGERGSPREFPESPTETPEETPDEPDAFRESAKLNAALRSQADAMRQRMQSQMQRMQQLQFQALQLAVPPPLAAPAPVTWPAVWASYGLERQVGLIWAAILAIGGALGLVLLALVRRRAVPKAVRRLGTMAVGLFVVYAGWHLVLFGREVMQI